MIEMKDAESAIKRLDEEIHKRIKDALSQSHKLYEAHKYKEAALALEESTKLGSFEGILSTISRSATTSSAIATSRSRIWMRRSPTRPIQGKSRSCKSS